MGKPGTLPLALNASLQRLGVQYLDIYLLHLPGILDKDRRKCSSALPNGPSMRAALWAEMTIALQSGLARAIGVANFAWRHLQPLVDSPVPPMVLQTEYSLLHHDEELRRHCRARSIAIIGYGSLANMLMNPKSETTRGVAEIANAHNASPTHVALSWTTRRGVAIIPRSFSAAHLAENRQPACDLSPAEDDALAALSSRERSRDLYGTRKVMATMK